MDINNKELELSLVGAVLNNNNNINEIIETVKPEMFIQHSMAHYWQTITSLTTEGKTVDAVSVGAEHSGAQTLALEHLMNERASTDGMVKEYAMLVKRQWFRRTVQEMATQIHSEAQSDIKDNQLIELLQERVMALNTTKSAYSVQNMNALLRGCIKEFEERCTNDGQVLGISSGFRDIDNRVYGYRGGNLVIIAARPAMGKTNLALNIARYNAMKGKHGIIFSLEMTSNELLERMITDAGSADYGSVRKGKIEAGEEYSNGVSALARHNIAIYDEPSITPSKALSIARKEKLKNGKVDFIIIDYLQLMTMAKSNNRTEEIGKISRSLKRMAKEFECPVFALSQLNRGLEQRVNKRPIMSDLRESGDIEQDADIIQFIYRDEIYDPNSDRAGLAEIITAKFRAGQIGTDVLKTQFNHCRFTDLDLGYELPEYEPKKKTKGFSG